MNIFKNILRKTMFMETVTTTLWSSLGKGAGLLIPFFIAAWFGVTEGTDAFFFVYGIAFFASSIFSIALESNIVPFIAELKAKDPENTGKVIARLFNISIPSSAVLVVVLAAASFYVFPVITDFPSGSYRLLYMLFMELCPMIGLAILGGIMSGILNSNFKFWAPAVSPGIRAVICVLSMCFLKKYIGVHSISAGYAMGEAVRFIFLFGVSLKSGIFKPSFDLRFDRELIGLWKRFSLQAMSLAASCVNPVVDKAMATWLGYGKVSIVQYADRIFYIPVTFIYSGFIVVMLSRWSDEHYRAEEGKYLLKGKIYKAWISVAVVSFVIIGLVWPFSGHIVRLLYDRGSFPAEYISQVNSTFLYYLSGLAFILLGPIAARGLIILKNTKALLVSALMSNVLNIAFNIIFMRRMGVEGLALSTTITGMICFFYLASSFNRQISRMGYSE